MSTFVHMELSTTDIQAAKQFYEGMFGWRFQDLEMSTGPYSMVMSADGVGIGGIQQNSMPETPNHWLGYVAVDSVARAIEKAEQLGGTVVVPATDVQGMGTLAIFQDPQGAAFAVWEAAAPAPAQADNGRASAKKTSKKSGAKKPAAKQAAPEQPPAAKQTAAKKGAAKKGAAKKGAAKEASAKKPAAKKTSRASGAASPPAAKKPAAKKPAAKKTSRPTGAERPAAKKPAAKKPAAKKR